MINLKRYVWCVRVDNNRIKINDQITNIYKWRDFREQKAYGIKIPMSIFVLFILYAPWCQAISFSFQTFEGTKFIKVLWKFWINSDHQIRIQNIRNMFLIEIWDQLYMRETSNVEKRDWCISIHETFSSTKYTAAII